MAVIKKTLFPKNLDKFAVLVNDTDPDSRYFKITELPDTFTGGKNAFLIAGSDSLVPDTRIQIELKDSAGNVIYHEPGEGLISSSINGEAFITEYYEGVSKVVAVYVYPDTAYGPCTLTILGELSEYEDGNGILTPVPFDWENKYNVKWQRQINVNPSLPNTTKIRFYRRPQVSITELLEPIYRIESGSKVNSGVSQSFADIKISNMETFAGDVKRIKVFRTSLGDISDFDLIQDILVESKELLTTFGLSGSAVGNTGIFTSETFNNFWNTGSLNASLSNDRIESGVKLTGNGYFTYTQSLDIKSANTYEINLDAFYSSSTSSNLGIYLSYVSQSTTFTSSIATLVGTQPTKNLLDTNVPFRVDRDYPSASLYFSQSQGEWHLGNIGLSLSQDTAFSPDEISFITTMPTVIGNETFNFKFEFYDVNNNFVPVAVTQSATFDGGTIIGAVDTDFIISASFVSASNLINAVSSSISGTMTVYSSSASSSVGILSGSVSASINSLSSSVSSSNSFILSSSFSKVQQLANGQYSGSFIGDTVIYSPTIGGQQGYISKLFTVGDTSAARINLDARNTSDGAPDNFRRIWIGTQPYGYHNNTNTSVYLDSAGKFSLGNKLVWDGTNLSVNGSITITNTIPNTSISGLGALATQSQVSNTQVTGLGALATRNNINLSFVTDAGAMAAINSITSGNASTYIGPGAIVSNFIAANTIVAGNIASNTITADQISGLNFTGKTATFNQGTVGGWTLADNLIYNSNVEIDNANSRIDFKSGGVVKTRITKDNVNIGSTATTTVTVPAQNPSTAVYSGTTSGANDRTLTVSQTVSEYAVTTPAGVTGNKLSIKIPTYGMGSLGTFTLVSVGNGTSYSYGSRAYITYKISSSPGGAGDIANSTYYFYNGFFNDVSVGTTTGTYNLPGVSAGSIPIYSGTATAGQVFYISTTYYVEVLTRGNGPSGAPPPTLTGTWYATAGGWPQVSSAAILVAVANRAEYGANGAQIGTNDGNYAAMGDAAGSGLSGLFNGGVQIFGTLTATLASSSDRRAKTNIKPLENATDTLKKLNPVSFDWLQHQINVNEFSSSYGFIADEVEEVLPNMVMKRAGLQYDDFKYLDYNSFHALAIKAILELTDKVENLEAKLSGSI